MNLPINKITLFSYGIMALPTAMAGIPLYIHAPDLYIKNYNISLATIATLLLFLRLFDAVIDPLIGLFCDKYRKFKNEIFLIGILLLGYGFYFLFNPNTTESIKTWFVFSVALTSIGFSIVSINLAALGGIWSNDYNIKTKISAFREGFGLVGLIIAIVLPPLLAVLDAKNYFKYFSVIMVFILIVCSIIFALNWLYKLPKTKKRKNETLRFTDCFLGIKINKRFFFIYFLSILSSSIPAVLVIFFIRDKLQLEQYLAMFLLAYFLSAAASMMFWNKVSAKYGKLKTWRFTMILGTITFIWVYFLNANDIYLYLIICILSGVAFGGELALPPAILADSTRVENSTTNYSILAFLSKSSFAFATGFSLMLLDNYGFKTGIKNSQNSLEILSFLYGALPCLIKVISIILLTKEVKNEKNFNYNHRGDYA